MACIPHAELYNCVDLSQVSKLEEWENLLTDDVFGIEEQVETYFKSLEGPSASGQQQVSVPGFIQQQTPGLIAQGNESSEPSASPGAGENLQDSVSGQQQYIVAAITEQVPSIAQGSGNLEEHDPPPPPDGHIDLEAGSSLEVDNNLQQNESSASNMFPEETSLGQLKTVTGSTNLTSRDLDPYR